MPVKNPYRRTNNPASLLVGEREDDLNKLRWVAPSLVKAGLIKNEQWIPNTAALVANTFRDDAVDSVVASATRLAIVHPYAFQYLEQAPILASVVLRPSVVPDAQMLIKRLQDWQELLHPLPKLNAILDQYHIPRPLRKLGAPQLHRNAFYLCSQHCFGRSNPSTIAQLIPPPEHQIEWQQRLIQWREYIPGGARTNGTEWFEWAARHCLQIARGSFQEVIDYINANVNNANPKMSVNTILELSTHWHAQFGRHRGTTFSPAITWDTPIDYESTFKLPNEAINDGYTFKALRMPGDFETESRELAHCVGYGSYARRVLEGKSAIYTVRKEYDNGHTTAATLELIRLGGFVPSMRDNWVINQFKGYRNSTPPNAMLVVAAKFVEHINGKT